MNTNQVKGKAKEIAGEIQEHAGRLVGSTTQEAKGHAREMAGKVQKKAGDVQDAIEDANDKTSTKY